MGCQPSHDAVSLHATSLPSNRSSGASRTAADAERGAKKNDGVTAMRAAAAAAEMASKCIEENSFASLGYGRRKDDQSENPLTAEQCRVIKETWTKTSPNLIAIGKKIFLRIFEFRPSVKYMFQFRDIWGDQLLRHPLFQEQARRFTRVIAAVVEAVDDLSSTCSPALAELGRKHVTMEGFMGNYFHVFMQAVMSVWTQELGDLCTPDVADAWRTLFEYIIKQLEDGYNTEMRARGLL